MERMPVIPDDAPATPAFISLIIFLGVNYLVGYDLGHLLTGSRLAGVALALLMPCLTLLLLALPKRLPLSDGLGSTAE